MPFAPPAPDDILEEAKAFTPPTPDELEETPKSLKSDEASPETDTLRAAEPPSFYERFIQPVRESQAATAIIGPTARQVEEREAIGGPPIAEGLIPSLGKTQIPESIVKAAELQPPESAGTTRKVASGIERALVRTAAGLVSPLGAAFPPLLQVGGLPARLATGAIAAQSAIQAPESIRRITQAKGAGETAESVTDALVNLGIGGTSALHALNFLPRAAKAAADVKSGRVYEPGTEPIDIQAEVVKEPSTTEVSNALPVEETGTIHGDVQEQPVVGQVKVPSTESPVGIPQRTEIAAPSGKPEKVSLTSKASPNDFVPALKQEGIEQPIIGKKGDIHNEIIARQPQDVKDALTEGELLGTAQRGFMQGGKFVTREEVSAQLGQKEPMQSERLRELQEAQSATAPPQQPPRPETAPERVVSETAAPAGQGTEGAVPGQVKQPWKMTREEFVREFESLEKKVKEAEKTPHRRMSASEVTAMRSDWKSYSRSRGYSEQQIADFERLQQLSLPLNDLVPEGESIPLLSPHNIHSVFVRRAIREGKPVPPEVLADYPDLNPPAPPAKVEAKVAVDKAQTAVDRRMEAMRSNTTKARESKGKEIKNELVARLEDAESKAPDADAIPEGALRQVIIDIPDDGSFTVVNTKEAISQTLERAKKINTKLSPSNPSPALRGDITPDVWVESSEPTHLVSKKLVSPGEKPLREGAFVERKAKPVTVKGAEDVPLFLSSDGSSFEVIEPRSGFRVGHTADSRSKAIKNAEDYIATLPSLKDAIALRIADIGEAPAPKPITSKRVQPPASGTGEERPISVGPGAMSRGTPSYAAMQQLNDRLTTAPPGGPKEKLNWREKAADAWSEGKIAVTKATAKLRAISASLKETARGVRTPTEMDGRLGELDYALQKSAAQSYEAGKTIRRTLPNETTRNAVAIWLDAGGDEAAIKSALAALPPETSPKIRRAVERAASLTPEGRALADEIGTFYGMRLDDAVNSDIFEKGLEDYYTHIWGKPEDMPDSLRAAVSNGKLSTYFQFGKQRKIPTFLEGILAGKKPVLDPAQVLPFYNYALDRAIASRQFIREISDMEAADGRPVLAATGTRQLIEGDKPTLLIRPQGKYGDLKGYRAVDHPALRKWKWGDTDDSGKTTLYQGELYVHPDHFTRLANLLDRGRLSPSPITRGLLRASTEVKGFKLGLLSLFHDVHVGTHAAWHWTNPFAALPDKPIDFEAPKTQFAIEKGHLKLAPDPGELNVFAEGLTSPGLVQKFPLIGPWSKAHSEWLFTEFIPKLKLRTFENAYQRNLWARDHLPGSGLKGLTDVEVAARVGDSVNNAYGELNHMFLGKNGRNPILQRILRLAFLAPDFGEARLRFAEKALTKTGFEERLALATMATTMYVAARIGNWMSHGDPENDWKNAFRVKSGDHWWSMRSVTGDLFHAGRDFGNFMYVRLNPLYSRTLGDVLYGRDVRTGQKLSALDKLVKRPLEQLVPIQGGGFTRDDQKVWESLVSALGVSATRETPLQAARRMFTEYREKSGDPKLVSQVERAQKEVLAPSEYRDLDLALQFNHYDEAEKAIEKLRLTHNDKDIYTRMNPFSKDKSGRVAVKPLFHDSKQVENRFKESLSDKERMIYERAVEDRRNQWQAFQSVWDRRGPRAQ